MSAGRPNIYSKELAVIICEEISTSSKSLRTICKDEKLPSVSTVLNWLKDIPEFLTQYTRAKEQQADFLAEEMIDIADDSSGDIDRVDEYGNVIENKEFTSRSRLRVETRKWAASKLKPKKYGDKLDLTSDGEKVGFHITLNL